MEWTVVTVLVALVGLFMTIGKPLINLNSNITKLNVTIERLEDDMAEQKKRSHESHNRLWEKNAEQDERLEDHEHRLSHLEGEHMSYHRQEEK